MHFKVRRVTRLSVSLGENQRRRGMEGASLTPEDLRLLSEWALGEDSGSSELQLLVGVQDDDAALQGEAAAPRRKRKKHPTYLRTREAKEGLQGEIAALEARLAMLKQRAGLEEACAISDEQTAVQNATLRGVLRQQHLAMAGARSMLIRCLNEHASHPLYTHIHLGKDWKARRQTLTSMKDVKLRNAFQYLDQRSSGLDELLPHASKDVTQDEHGNFICSEFEVVQFTNVRSIREVYDAIVYFFAHEEIVLSELMGFLAIQDDFEMVGGNSVNQRMYWIDGNGVTTEWNSVNFANIFDGGYAVLTSDSVDVDERYPFQPAIRVRRDWSGGILLSTAKNNDESGSVVVVMRSASITKLVLPAIPLESEMKDSLVKGVFNWGEALLASIRSQLSFSTSAPAVVVEK